ncbi:MAG: LL-diaminopimelate aminotransferase [bacterium]
MDVKTNKRFEQLPPYLFAEIDRKKFEAQQQGRKIISLGVGDPDMPTPERIVKAGQEALKNPSNHHYPFGIGLTSFRETVAKWMRARFNIQLDLDREIIPLIGSKEGLAHLLLAFVDTDDVVLVPEPGYPLYYHASIFADAKPYYMPLLKENGFMPDLEAIPKNVLNKAKCMFLNYPNNPTSALATEEFLNKVVEFAEKYGILIAYDAAYSELYFDKPPVSFLSVKGAMNVGIEFHSLSKTFNMTGWRIGWAAGNRKIIEGLKVVKDSYDSGVFNAVQEAAVTALNNYYELTDPIRKIYKSRRDVFVGLMKEAGWEIDEPKATFYVWAKPPKQIGSKQLCLRLMDEANIIATPGVGFGPSGEGYVRFALTVNEEVLRESVEKINAVKW